MATKSKIDRVSATYTRAETTVRGGNARERRKPRLLFFFLVCVSMCAMLITPDPLEASALFPGCLYPLLRRAFLSAPFHAHGFSFEALCFILWLIFIVYLFFVFDLCFVLMTVLVILFYRLCSGVFLLYALSLYFPAFVLFTLFAFRVSSSNIFNSFQKQNKVSTMRAAS